MNLPLLFKELGLQLARTSVYEWIAVIFGVFQVLLAWKNKVLLYPAGIISTVFSVFILAEARLYAESFLNLYYLAMSIYGWIHWQKNKYRKQLPVTRANRQEWMITFLIVFGGWLILFLVLNHFTPSDVPVWDAWVSATAWAGMWLLARRKLENWILLNISNAFAIPLQFHKDIPLYGLLTFILFIVAIFGYYNWRRIISEEKKQTAS